MNKLLITKIKNESDIIEFFLRYHIRYFDHIVVIENGSMDGTYEIINALIEEGLPIELINVAYSEFDEYKFINKYAKCCVEKYQADIVAFMDADEFLVSESEKDKCCIWDKIDLDKISRVKWKTFLYEKDSEIFNPELFVKYRDEIYETFEKIIVPGKFIINNMISIESGNHSYNTKYNIQNCFVEDLKFYHFPIRSLNQYKKQVLLNTINMLENPEITIQTGAHWKEMATINDVLQKLQTISKNYAFYNGEKLYTEENNIKNIVTKYNNLINCDFEKICLKYMELQALKLKKEKIDKGSEDSIREKIIVFGFGDYCKKMISRIDKRHYELVALVDSDKNKQYLTYHNKIVISPEKMRFFDFTRIIIASKKYYDEIYKTILLNFPFIAEEKICTIDEFLLEQYQSEM